MSGKTIGDNYTVVKLTKETPELRTTTEESHVRYDKNGNAVPDNRSIKQITDSILPPSAEFQEYFDNTLRPEIEKRYGFENGELKTPLADLLGYDVEAERERREKEKELNEFKRKEANWYNGVSLLMDIAGAAGKANVRKRTPSTVSAEALDNEDLLHQEELAEEAAIKAARQKRLNDMYDKQDEILDSAKRKVQTIETDNPIKRITKYTPARRETREEIVRHFKDEDDTSGNGKGKGGGSGSYTRSGGGGGGGSNQYLGMTVMVNGKPENREIPLSSGMYKKMLNDVKSHYIELMKNGDNGVEQFLISKGIIDKIPGYTETYRGKKTVVPDKITWNDEIILANGIFYKLSEEQKKEIVKKSGGEIEFVEGTSGIDVIQPKGSAQPFRYEEDEEDEELMGR